MAHFVVGPKKSGSRWKVEKDGTEISKHNSKSNAVQTAKQKMRKGDTGVVQKRNGQFQRKL